LERAIQAIWSQVLRGDLEATKTLAQLVRLKIRLCDLDVRREVAAGTEAAPVLYQVDGGDPKPLEELTDEELATTIAFLEQAVHGDGPSQSLPETDSPADPADQPP